MMAEKPQPMVNGSNDIYLQNGPLYDLDNEEIIKLAGNLRLQNDADSARAIYDWVKNNLDYSGYIASDRGASYAMRTRQGDCTEYAYLLAALARINNIPARIMAGFVYANNAILRPYDYHNWVELYVDDRWQIVDPLNDVFFEQKASHVALRIIGGEGRLNYLASQKGIESDPRLEVKMQ
jgi:transglutaminase-like putative cysteine protease